MVRYGMVWLVWCGRIGSSMASYRRLRHDTVPLRYSAVSCDTVGFTALPPLGALFPSKSCSELAVLVTIFGAYYFALAEACHSQQGAESFSLPSLWRFVLFSVGGGLLFFVLAAPRDCAHAHGWGGEVL